MRSRRVRFAYRIRGQVQGVGFRPFIYRIAHVAGVTGFVRNDMRGVYIEAQGTAAAVRAYERLMATEIPPLARVDDQRRTTLTEAPGETDFYIDQSTAGIGEKDAAVTVDSAVCKDCLREMFSKTNRRFGHAMINCTNCGPRFSIIRDIPYDRPNTTMAPFAMCTACQKEYDDPADRRFHAQPTCCPKCGPTVTLARVARNGANVEAIKGDVFEQAAKLLCAGKILAIKGIGGFHLAVRADWQNAVKRLCRLKRRDAKPFALMCRDLKMARRLVQLSKPATRELTSPAAPIILATRNAGANVAHDVAPGTNLLGVMLPYTPIHLLLWQALEKACSQATESPPPLVMTSGNLSSEPLVTDNAQAIALLAPLCDALLWHNRDIERSVDDSVLLDRGPHEPVLPIRRSRGYVPTAWPLPKRLVGGPTGLCLGGELKNTLALVRDGNVILSQHFGDLTQARGFEQFQKAIKDLVKLFELRVEFIAHDLHPGYMSTLAAKQLAKHFGAKLIGIQHHAAHAFGVLAEHGITRPALAIVCDGTGFGTDGTIWGGELLSVNGAQWQRVGALRPMRLPGGDAAALNPRRSALSLLYELGGDGFIHTPAARRLFPNRNERLVLASMIRTGLNSPWTSSTGRLFDAVAALLGICTTNNHEAQAAMALEAAATLCDSAKLPRKAARIASCKIYRNETEHLWELDPRPMLKSLFQAEAKKLRAPEKAWIFHLKLAEGWIDLARAAAVSSSILSASGGVLCNALFAGHLCACATRHKFQPLFHNTYPPTDAGLAFGQAIYARELLHMETT